MDTQHLTSSPDSATLAIDSLQQADFFIGVTLETRDVAKPSKKSETKVTRITATDSSSAPKKPKAKQVKPAPKAAKTTKTAKTTAVTAVKKEADTAKDAPRNRRRIRAKNPFAPFWRYLKGAWYELRQVRWPDRRSTWKMTGALLLFTFFFVVIILLLDAGFSELFKLIMGK